MRQREPSPASKNGACANAQASFASKTIKGDISDPEFPGSVALFTKFLYNYTCLITYLGYK